MRINVDVSGFEEVAENIDGLSEGLLEAARKGLQAGMQPMVANAKLLVRSPGKGGTGQLRNSIGAKAEVQGLFIVGTFYASAEHTIFVEFGTGPKGEESHEGIAPDANPTYTTKGWVYRDPRTGEFWYTLGQPASPFMYPAFKAGESQLPEKVRQAILRAYPGG